MPPACLTRWSDPCDFSETRIPLSSQTDLFQLRNRYASALQEYHRFIGGSIKCTPQEVRQAADALHGVPDEGSRRLERDKADVIERNGYGRLDYARAGSSRSTGQAVAVLPTPLRHGDGISEYGNQARLGRELQITGRVKNIRLSDDPLDFLRSDNAISNDGFGVGIGNGGEKLAEDRIVLASH